MLYKRISLKVVMFGCNIQLSKATAESRINICNSIHITTSLNRKVKIHTNLFAFLLQRITPMNMLKYITE